MKMITHRGRILKFRIIRFTLKSTNYFFFREWYNFLIPNRPPNPSKISIPVIGASGSPGFPGCAKTNAGRKTKIAIRQTAKKYLLVLIILSSSIAYGLLIYWTHKTNQITQF
jgi:hypothetical protein